MEILFAGTDGVLPVVPNDTASVVVDRQLMIDFGWHGACQLEAYGVEPWNLLGGCLSHIHQDHFLGLAPLLFYHYLCQSKKTALEPLKILGPTNKVIELVDRAMSYMLAGGSDLPIPEVEAIPVKPGDQHVIGDLTVQVGPSHHNMPSVSYRIVNHIQDESTSIVYSGDTGYCPELGAFAHNTDLLVHEASRGMEQVVHGSGHATFSEACKVADQAGAGAMALVHMTPETQQTIAVQTEIQQPCDDVFLPMAGDKIVVDSHGAQLHRGESVNLADIPLTGPKVV